MLSFFLNRVFSTVPMLVLLSLFVFMLGYLIPGDAAEIVVGDVSAASAQEVERIREQMGTNLPILEQFARFTTGVLRGDLGTSLFGSTPVFGAVMDRLPATLSLTIASVFIALVVGLGAGIAGALQPGSWIDRLSTLGASVGLAVPNFWLALVLLNIFSLSLRWFPATGYVPFAVSPMLWAQGIVLPAVALGSSASAVIARQTRSALSDALQSDYVRTARAKGVDEFHIVIKHALKNAAMPVVTVLGITVTTLLGGSVIVEQVFAIPGLGSLAITAVNRRDIPMIQGIVFVAAVVVVATNFFIDIAYGLINPKVRTS